MDAKLFMIIVESMIIAQKEQIENKKEFVLLEIKKYINNIDDYERYELFISLTIDGLKYLSKSNLLKNLKNSKCCI